MKRGWLIAFEGIDGSGKTTQVERLAASLRARGLEVVTTREPTDGRFGRRIRAMAASSAPPAPEEELGWFVEDRREHVKEVVAPALGRGAVVITDRYFLSTVAYQGARGHDARELLERCEAEFPIPDLVLLLEVAPAAGLARARRRGGAAEPVFEQRAYLERVSELFGAIDRGYLVRIDADAPPEEVQARIARIVAERLDLPCAR